MKNNASIKVVAILLIAILLLTGCSAKLTDDQITACEEADVFMSAFADEFGYKYTSEVEQIEGKLVLVGKLDSDGGFGDSDANIIMEVLGPVLEEGLGAHGLYTVLYLSENGKEVYRIIDSRLDPDILD